MSALVLAVGVLLVCLSLYFMALPRRLRVTLDRVYSSRWLYGVALSRLLLGAGLIAAAPSVGYSIQVELAGWLFVLAGLGLVALPPAALRGLVAWFGGLSATLSRLWLSLALLLGLFFIFAWSS